MGVSDNVVEASWQALLDAVRLELMRLKDQDASSGVLTKAGAGM